MWGVLAFSVPIGFAPLVLTLALRLLGLAIAAIELAVIVGGVLIGGLVWIGWFVIQPSAARAALKDTGRQPIQTVILGLDPRIRRWSC
jgi:hypothetical protein